MCAVGKKSAAIYLGFVISWIGLKKSRLPPNLIKKDFVSRWRGFGGKGGSSIKGKEKEMRETLKRNHDLSVKVSGQICLWLKYKGTNNETLDHPLDHAY